MSDEKANDRLIRLLDRIKAEARHWTIRYPQAGVDADDCTQESIVAFLKRSHKDPGFRELSDDDAVHRAVLDGWNQARAYRRHSRCIPLEPVNADDETYESTIIADVPSPEEIVIAQDLSDGVQRIIAGLSPTYRAVCQGLMADLPKGKIMASLGVRAQNFTWYRRKLAVAFRGVA